MKKFYREITIKSWDKFNKFIEIEFLKKITLNKWIFRGINNSNHKLETSFERLFIKKEISLNYEIEIIRLFQKKIHFYLPNEHIPNKDDRIGWLSLLQHYGAPTRLLDFTYSPYIASFFAFEKKADEGVKDVSIWAINKSYLEYTIEKYEKNTKYEPHEIIDIFKNGFSSNFGFNIPLDATFLNERLSIQQGVFLCQGSADMPFEEGFNIYDKKLLNDNILKINIPASERENFIKRLILMNITSEALFPGLEGFIRSLHIFSEQKWDLFHNVTKKVNEEYKKRRINK